MEPQKFFSRSQSRYLDSHQPFPPHPLEYGDLKTQVRFTPLILAPIPFPAMGAKTKNTQIKPSPLMKIHRTCQNCEERRKASSKLKSKIIVPSIYMIFVNSCAENNAPQHPTNTKYLLLCKNASLSRPTIDTTFIKTCRGERKKYRAIPGIRTLSHIFSKYLLASPAAQTRRENATNIRNTSFFQQTCNTLLQLRPTLIISRPSHATNSFLTLFDVGDRPPCTTTDCGQRHQQSESHTAHPCVSPARPS